MPTFRSDIEELHPYVPGRGYDEIRRAYGLDDVVKLASNESPIPPFPEVVERIAELAAGVNRYPETLYTDLRAAIGQDLGVSPDTVWLGGGGTDLLLQIAITTGGPGHSAVYPWPSFVMYPLASQIALTERIPVPLDPGLGVDLDALGVAIRADTTVVYVCNPNNPTGTHLATDDVLAFASDVPDSVLVVVDEAYRHYVTADDYRTLASVAATTPNLMVLHTFSKVFGLAGLRIGYVIGHPDTVDFARRSQPPFTVSTLAQEAALTAMALSSRLEERVAANTAGRAALIAGLRARGYEPTDSQTNFVFFAVADAAGLVEHLLRSGVIVRPMGPSAVRVTVGTEDENERFLRALPPAS